MMKKIICVVGARPNLMKMAPIMNAFAKHGSDFSITLVHTGQHYDENMNNNNIRALNIPIADVQLGVGSGSHALQTAEVMRRFEPVLDEKAPDAVLVVGDVNSTLACALVAAKKQVPVIHVEAGLRSKDRSMPEEINRILTDQISDYLFTSERKAADNLEREGIDPSKIYFVGNVMIDTLLGQKVNAISLSQTLKSHGITTPVPQNYAVLTLHRPANVDDPAILQSLLRTLAKVSEGIPIIFPVHPRTRENINRFNLSADFMTLLPPLNYLEMLGLMQKSSFLLTDSGGIQEEATCLGIPCLTLRNNTERPITIEQGTNTLVGYDSQVILKEVQDILKTGGKKGRIPELWDGRSAERIVKVLKDQL